MINSGILQIGNGGTTGTLGSGVLYGQRAFSLGRSDGGTVTAAISGSGGLSILNAATLTLEGW